jgi:hypothetical protein
MVEVRSVEIDAEAVQLLPARMELALVNLHISGNGNGNKGTVNILSGNTL